MSALPLSTPLNPAPALGVILRGLAALIARRFVRHPVHAALTIPLWQHLSRAALRLETLLARLAAGPLPAPKPRSPHKGGPRRKPVFPTTNAWLIRALGPEAAACAAQLNALLSDPAAADLLACPAARRTLAPIRRMLGLTPPRQRRPVARATAPAPAAPPRRAALIPHHPSIDPRPNPQRRPWWLPPPRLRAAVPPPESPNPLPKQNE